MSSNARNGLLTCCPMRRKISSGKSARVVPLMVRCSPMLERGLNMEIACAQTKHRGALNLERQQQSQLIIMSTFSASSISAIVEATKVKRVHGLSKDDFPLVDTTVVRDEETTLEIVDKTYRVVVKHDVSGLDGIDEMYGLLTGGQAEDELDSADEDALDVVMVLLGGGESVASVRSLPSDRVFVAISDAGVDADKLVDLLVAISRASVVPFADHPSRTAWKAARKPVVDSSSEWEPSSGQFDVPILRRAATIVQGANKRLEAAYETAFRNKLVTTTRSAVGRWAKKAGVAAPDPATKKKKTATGAAPTSEEGDEAAADDTATGKDGALE